MLASPMPHGRDRVDSGGDEAGAHRDHADAEQGPDDAAPRATTDDHEGGGHRAAPLAPGARRGRRKRAVRDRSGLTWAAFGLMVRPNAAHVRCSEALG